MQTKHSQIKPYIQGTFYKKKNTDNFTKVFIHVTLLMLEREDESNNTIRIGEVKSNSDPDHLCQVDRYRACLPAGTARPKESVMVKTVAQNLEETS
jgi:hypothetical protein